jgi:hypothetical protein
MAIPYGIGVQRNRDILHILVPSGIARNKVAHNSVAIKCTMVASRWTQFAGNNHPYPLPYCDHGRNHLRRMGLPPNLQRASLAPPAVSRSVWNYGEVCCRTLVSTVSWGWGRRRGLDLKPYGDDARFVNECTGCHQPMRGNDYVFTLPITTATLNRGEVMNNGAAALPANFPINR